MSDHVMNSPQPSTVLADGKGGVAFNSDNELIIMVIHHEGGRHRKVAETSRPETEHEVHALGWIGIEGARGNVTYELIDDGRVLVWEDYDEPNIYFADSSVLTGILPLE